MRLDALQKGMVDAIDKGPSFIAGDAYVGGRKAAMRGLSVHANTISHARLVALEETFPKLRETMGHERFNALSRDYVATREAMGEPPSTIGRHFPAFLESRGEPNEHHALAAFEWAWLESYNAAEVDAIELSEFAGVEEGALLATVVALHPAAWIAPARAAFAIEDEVPGVCGSAALLITRPDAEVLVSPASAIMLEQFIVLSEPQAICNLLQAGDEQGGEDALQGVLALLAARSLVLTR